MTDETQAQSQMAAPTTELKRTWTEAPYSGNVRTRLEGFDWQFTIRAETGKELIEKTNGLMKWLADKHAEKGGQQIIATAQAMSTNPPPPPVPLAPVPQTQGTIVQCQMIEVGLSYTGNKTQLKFHCNGMDKPLTYTKSIEDMAKLLAPLGFTAAHIVVGQKYATNAMVTYARTQPNAEGKSYNNITAITKAA